MFLLVLIFESPWTLYAVEFYFVQVVHFKASKLGYFELFLTARTRFFLPNPLIDAALTVNVFTSLTFDWVFHDKAANRADEAFCKFYLLLNHLFPVQFANLLLLLVSFDKLG